MPKCYTYLWITLEVSLESWSAFGPHHVAHFMLEAKETITEVIFTQVLEGCHLLHGHGGVQLQVGSHHTYLLLLHHLIKEHLQILHILRAAQQEMYEIIQNLETKMFLHNQEILVGILIPSKKNRIRYLPWAVGWKAPCGSWLVLSQMVEVQGSGTWGRQKWSTGWTLLSHFSVKMKHSKSHVMTIC